MLIQYYEHFAQYNLKEAPNNVQANKSRYYDNIRSTPQLSSEISNLSFRLMPKDISGGGLVDFEIEISQLALMQVFVS